MEKRVKWFYLVIILTLVVVAFLCGVIFGGTKSNAGGAQPNAAPSVMKGGSPDEVVHVEALQPNEKPNQRFDAEFIKLVRNRAIGYGMHPNWYLVIVRTANEAGVSEAHVDAMIRSMIWNLQLAGRGRGTSAVRAFNVMGVTPEELSVMNTDAQFMAIARMFKNYHGNESRFALATDIFSGAATAECVAFICQGDEQIRSNYIKFKAEGSLLTDEQLGVRK